MLSRFLQRSVLQAPWKTTSPRFSVFGVADLRSFATNSRKSSGSRGKSGPSIIRNEGIKAKTMRVVYTDPATNESAWKIMDRKEAIEFAKGMELDLVLVNGDSDPAVCKIQDYGRLVMDKSKEAKEKKVSQKARSLKEMFVKGGIEENDLKTKIKKVRQFLLVGHTVKIVVIAKKDILRRNPHAIDETTLKIIEKVEDYVKTVKQGRAGSAFRSDFILNPKTGEEIKKLQEDVAKQQKGELGDEVLAA